MKPARLAAIVVAAVLLGLATDALREERVLFQRKAAPTFQTVPAP